MKLTKTQEYFAAKLEAVTLYPFSSHGYEVRAISKGHNELISLLVENGFKIFDLHPQHDKDYIAYPVDARQMCINDFWDKMRDGFAAARGGSKAHFQDMKFSDVVGTLAQNGFRMIYKKEWVIRE